jgi:hypothetical protein
MSEYDRQRDIENEGQRAAISPERKVKVVPKASVPKPPAAPDVMTVTVEIPVTVDHTSEMRNEIRYLLTLMRRYPGPAGRFYKEMKFT